MEIRDTGEGLAAEAVKAAAGVVRVDPIVACALTFDLPAANDVAAVPKGTRLEQGRGYHLSDDDSRDLLYIKETSGPRRSWTVPFKQAEYIERQQLAEPLQGSQAR